jgi:hypothetical protein
MIRLRAFAVASCLCLGSLVIAPMAQAQIANLERRTVVRVAEPTEVPGGPILQPGDYVFRIMDSKANRHIVQIYNADESQILGSILAYPNFRTLETGLTQFDFWEVPVGAPPAIRTWFYPGDLFGQEFPAPTAPVAVAVAPPAPAAPVTTTYAQVQPPLAQAPVERVPPAEVVEVAPPPPPPVAEVRPPVLPVTASGFPLLGLAGLLALGAAFLTRAIRRRVR